MLYNFLGPFQDSPEDTGGRLVLSFNIFFITGLAVRRDQGLTASKHLLPAPLLLYLPSFSYICVGQFGPFSTSTDFQSCFHPLESFLSLIACLNASNHGEATSIVISTR